MGSHVVLNSPEEGGSYLVRVVTAKQFDRMREEHARNEKRIEEIRRGKSSRRGTRRPKVEV